MLLWKYTIKKEGGEKVSSCSTKCARLSRVAKVKEIQDKALDREQYNKALSCRSASPSGIPGPKKSVKGARVWQFD